MSQLTISGAVSNLDTAGIINSLVTLQGNQQTLLRNRQSTVQRTADAYAAVISSLGALSTQAKKVADTGAWAGLTTTSSTTSVTAKATGSTPGSLTFDVTAVAARHAVVSPGTFGSTAAVVASAGPLTLTKSDGSTTTIDVGSGTLDDVVAAINAAKAGVTATAVQVSPGQFRLQVAAASTGTASAFSLDGLDTATDVLQQGSDATIHLGDALTGYDITSASNTFSDVVPGLSFTVSKAETAVTVSSALDGTAVASSVQALVDAANSVLSDITAKSTWNSTTKTGGPLTGSSSVRSLAQSILSTVGGAGAAGVSLTREGKLAFDQSAFVAAYAADPAGVAAAYGASVAFTPAAGVTGRIGLVRAGDTAKAGAYAVNVSVAAAREQWQVDSPGSLEGLPLVLSRSGGDQFSYTAPTGESLADSVLAINARLAAAGFGVGATVSGSSVVFTATSPGSGAAFAANLDGVDGAQLVAGTDVAGSIDGLPASGGGNVLSLLSGTSDAVGLSLSVDVTGADIAASGGDVGTVRYTQGLAQRLAGLVSDATSTGGLLTTAKDGSAATVKDLQTQIDSWDNRLESYRLRLTRQFTAMETALANLKSQTSFLSGLSTSSTSSTSSSSSS